MKKEERELDSESRGTERKKEGRCRLLRAGVTFYGM